jgi:hypothetical protein
MLMIGNYSKFFAKNMPDRNNDRKLNTFAKNNNVI